MNDKKGYIVNSIISGTGAILGLVVIILLKVIELYNPSLLQELLPNKQVLTLYYVIASALLFFGVIASYIHLSNIYKGQDKTLIRIKVIFAIVLCPIGALLIALGLTI